MHFYAMPLKASSTQCNKILLFMSTRNPHGALANRLMIIHLLQMLLIILHHVSGGWSTLHPQGTCMELAPPYVSDKC